MTTCAGLKIDIPPTVKTSGPNGLRFYLGTFWDNYKIIEAIFIEAKPANFKGNMSKNDLVLTWYHSI